MIITLSGSPGSGKSTVAKKLANTLKYKYFDGGRARRDIAKEKEMTLSEFNAWSKKNPKGDTIVDNYIKKFGKTNPNTVFSSRTAFYFFPDSIKIFLYTDYNEGAKRIWKDYKKNSIRQNEDKVYSIEELENSLKKRVKNDEQRLKKLYNINILDKNSYDLWLDTTNLNKREEFNTVYKYIKNRLKNA